MNEIFIDSNVTRTLEKGIIVYNQDKLFSTNNLPKILSFIPENLQKQFMNGYIWLRTSDFWDYLEIIYYDEGCAHDDLYVSTEEWYMSDLQGTLHVNIYVRRELDIPFQFNSSISEFFHKRLKDFCLPLGAAFFQVSKNEIFSDYNTYKGANPIEEKTKHNNFRKSVCQELGYEWLDKRDAEEKEIRIKNHQLNIDEYTVSYKIEIQNKKSMATMEAIKNMITDYYKHLCPKQYKKWLANIINVRKEVDDESIKKIPFCEDLKSHLVEKGLITKKYTLKTYKKISDKKNALLSFKEVKLEAERFYKSIYLKTNCPICGKQYVKDRKNKTTCGNYNCKILKSRMLKKIKKFSSLSPEEFYQKLVEVDNHRIFVCKRNEMYSYKTISNLRKLSDILYDDIVAA